MRKAYLASIVPVIVNAILNEHQVIVDIIAFVSKGDFPRSRLGEKQRGKILASWVTRKMRTIAQFGIRDADAADSQITEVAEPRSRVGSVVGKGSSLRNVETIDARPMNGRDTQQQLQEHLTHDYSIIPPGVSEMPAAHYESSIVESPPLATNEVEDTSETPVNSSNRHSYFNFENSSYNQSQRSTDPPPLELPGHSTYEEQQHTNEPPSPPPKMNKPAGPTFEITPPKPRHTQQQQQQQQDRPVPSGGRDSLPSQQLRHHQTPSDASERGSSQTYHSSSWYQEDLDGRSRTETGRLRIANAGDEDEKADWPQEALMHMNLSSNGGGGNDTRRGGRGGSGGSQYNDWDDGYDGRGYGNAL